MRLVGAASRPVGPVGQHWWGGHAGAACCRPAASSLSTGPRLGCRRPGREEGLPGSSVARSLGAAPELAPLPAATPATSLPILPPQQSTVVRCGMPPPVSPSTHPPTRPQQNIGIPRCSRGCTPCPPDSTDWKRWAGARNCRRHRAAAVCGDRPQTTLQPETSAPFPPF